MSPLSCCMEVNVLGLMEEPHVEENHEEGAYFQLLVEGYAIEDIGQTSNLLQQYIQEDIPFIYASKGT